jgi:hypothetical protein
MPAEPIASVKRLKELGLEPAGYGSCSEPEQRSIKNKGKTWINRGCAQYHDCDWKDGTEHMERRDETDTVPRPRNVVTKFIKPNPMGPGDRVINSYCSCFQFLGGMKRRDGRNNEIAEVVGGEGDMVKIKGNERKTNPDGTFYFKPTSSLVRTPRFLDPTEVDELFEDVDAGRDRIQNKAKTTDAERARRVSGSVKKDAIEGVTIADLDARSA